MPSLPASVAVVVLVLAVVLLVMPAPRARRAAGSIGTDRRPGSRDRRREARDRTRRSRLPGPLLFDLVAALLDAGSAPGAALTAVGTALERRGDPRGVLLTRLAAQAHDGLDVRAADPSLAPLQEALRLAVLSGMPPAGLVRRAAEQERARLQAQGRRAAKRLEVLLVLPVGLCLLPAFVLLGIAPTVIDLLTG